jgi:alpha-amylase
LRDKIIGLINARKVAGVHAGSPLHLQDNARLRRVYAAMIEGTKGQLYVRIGGDDSDWVPHHSNYRDYREYVQGAGWKVWVKLPGNPEIQKAALKTPFPIPQYRPADQIDVPESWVE